MDLGLFWESLKIDHPKTAEVRIFKILAAFDSFRDLIQVLKEE